MVDDLFDQTELFLCNLSDWNFKDDIISMESPVFSLTKNIHNEVKTYNNNDKFIKIIPTAKGSPTIFDKDLLLYVSSQIIEAMNQKLPVSRTVKIKTTDFLKKTARSDGRASYERIEDMLIRLRGTTIETNIETNGIIQTEGFSFIDSYSIISQKNSGEGNNSKKRVLEFSVTLNEWLFNALIGKQILTINPDYFKLKKPIERRLYELARKFCGANSLWKININLLAEKIGVDVNARRRREDIRNVMSNNALPDYKVALEIRKGHPDLVVFYTRDVKRLTVYLLKENLTEWFERLEK